MWDKVSSTYWEEKLIEQAEIKVLSTQSLRVTLERSAFPVW